MENKNTILAIIAVVIVVVVAVAAYSMMGGDDEVDDDVTFLIQDDMGVYFWVNGEGDNVFEAFVDATEKYDMPFKASVSDGKENGIESLFGLSTKQVGTDWIYWSQYSYIDGAWKFNESYMD